MTSIRFLHIADLHLDSPFKGMTHLPENRFKDLRESTFNAFEKIITYALNEKPDFVVIVGDIYDGEDRSLRAQQRFQRGMERLNEANIPVFISYGNHDHLGGKWIRFELPENVSTFGKKTSKEHLSVNGQDVFLYGFSYKERHIREAVIDSYPAADRSDAFHIGLLHGSLLGDESHAVYAPFTKEQLLLKNYDYWALGHIHARQILHEEPYIVYPGNIQSRHRNERGLKGFYDVTLTKGSTELTFVPSSAIVYDEIHVSCQNVYHANEWMVACEKAINEFRETHSAGVAEIILFDINETARAMFEQTPIDEWLQLLRESQEEIDPYVWIQSMTFQSFDNDFVEPSALTQSVLNLMDDWEEEEWKNVVKDVYQHTRGIRYLDPLSEEDVQSIKKVAADILLKEMSGKD